jgi:predicted XRE-type DNA-binding protein
MRVNRIKGKATAGAEELDYAAANIVMRAELMSAITDLIRQNGWTQGQAAEVLGVGQPRISDVAQGRVDRFSVDMLIVWLQKLGKDVTVSVRDNVFASQDKVNLSLFVCGTADEQLLSNVSRLFAGNRERYSLKIVDVLQNPELAYKERISSTPCLIKESPGPRIVLSGDMSAASIRWQLASAERFAQEERNEQIEVREKEQDLRQETQDLRQRTQEVREKELDKRQPKR